MEIGRKGAALEDADGIHDDKEVGGGHEAVKAEAVLRLWGGTNAELGPNCLGAVVLVGVVPPFWSGRFAVGDEPAVGREGYDLWNDGAPMADIVELVAVTAGILAHFSGGELFDALDGGIFGGIGVVSEIGERRPVPDCREDAVEELGG